MLMNARTTSVKTDAKTQWVHLNVTVATVTPSVQTRESVKVRSGPNCIVRNNTGSDHQSTDINECIQIDNPVCSGKKVCQNNAGNYACECPPGTKESNGDCVGKLE